MIKDKHSYLQEKAGMSHSSITGRRLIYPLFAASAIVLLSGCADGSLNTPQPPTAVTPIMPEAQHYGDDAFIYTAQFLGNDLSVYSRNGFNLQWNENLTYHVSAPFGTVVTVNGYWYVANGGDSDVLIYRTDKSGPSGPIGELHDYGQVPVNVDTTPSRQVVGVSNLGSASKAGSLSVYLNRAVDPSRVLTYGSDVLQGAGVAVDHQGDCYWSFNDPTTASGSIVEFAGCNGSGSVVVAGIPQAGGIAFDQSDDLYYVNEKTGSGTQWSGVYQCQKTSACQLIPKTTMFGLPTNINFDFKDKNLWVADASGYIGIIELQKKNKVTVTKIPAHGGSADPPYGVAPVRGGS